MAVAMPVIAGVAAALLAIPAIETTPYVGEPPVTSCEYALDGKWLPKVGPTETDMGSVCRVQLPAGMTDGVHQVKARYWFRTDGKDVAGPRSGAFFFRQYKALGGASFWTWDGAVVCEDSCVSK